MLISHGTELLQSRDQASTRRAVSFWPSLSCFVPFLIQLCAYSDPNPFPTPGIMRQQLLSSPRHTELWDREPETVQPRALQHKSNPSSTIPPRWKVNSSVTPEGGNTPSSASSFHQESTCTLYRGRTSPTQLWEQEIDAVPSALDMDKNLISILSCSLLITVQINYSAAERKMFSLVISPKNLIKWGNRVKLWQNQENSVSVRIEVS